MTMWRCEGRCVVILVTFMVQTLFIISGVGAENTTVMTSLPHSSVVASVSAPTSSKGPLTSISGVGPENTTVMTSLPHSSVVTSVSAPTSSKGPLTSIIGVGTESTLTSSPAQQSITRVVTSALVPTSSKGPLTSSSAKQSITSVVTSALVPTSSKGPLTSSSAQSSITKTPQLSAQSSIQTSMSLLVQATMSAVGPSPHKSITTSFTSSVSISATSASEQKLHIVMTFKMPWRRLCFLLSLFKQALSDDLIEMKDLKYQFVNPGRIKFINNLKCENKAYYNDNAVLKFYISENRTEDLTSNRTVDREMTIKAFKILYYYWVNKRMILLDKMFEKKVEKVELKENGTDADITIPKYTEAQRIGIGIGVGLALVVLILLIYCCVRGCVEVKSVGHSTEEKRMVFTNTVAINEEARTDTEGCEDTESVDTPRSDLKKTEEPEEVVIHTQPLAKTQDEMPLRSVINDNEDDQTESDEKSDPEKAPLAKPEPDNVSEGEPIKSIDEPEAEPIKSPDEPEGEPANKHEAAVGSEDAPPVSKPSVTEKPPETGEDTVTSSVTIVITPDSGPATIEFPVAETALEPANEDDVKPDFGQSDNIDVDPSQGAINMAFDDKDEATGEGDEEEDEETKF